MTSDKSYEPKEIVIDIGETIPTDEERIAMWKEINKRDDINFECSKCVWGIQDMERGCLFIVTVSMDGNISWGSHLHGILRLPPLLSRHCVGGLKIEIIF